MIRVSADRLAGELRELYRRSESAKDFLDSLSRRQRDSRETGALRAATLVGVSYKEMLAVYRSLDAMGAGEFIAGRRGYKSRFKWRYSPKSLAGIARMEADRPDPLPDDALVEEFSETSTPPDAGKVVHEQKWIAHKFQLRPDLSVEIRLPENLTTREAERVSGFIMSVPFGE